MMLKTINHFLHTHIGAACLMVSAATFTYVAQDIQTAYSQTNEYEGRLRNIANNDIKKWANDPVIVQAIKEQNEAHNTLSLIEIEKLDKEWRLQINNVNRPLVEAIKQKKISEFLVDKQLKSDGLYREIMVMDNRGLIVGGSIVSSDYWQGDEAKWRQTFKVGPGAVFIDNVAYDDSAEAFQAQVSLTISEGDAAIGAITVGIDTEKMDYSGR